MKNLRWKLAASSFVGGLVLVMAGAAWVAVSSAGEASRWTQKALDVRDESRVLRASLLDVEGNQRNFVLTRKDAYLELYQAARDRIPAQLARLRDLADQGPSEERVTLLGPEVDKLLAHLEQALDALQLTGQDQALDLVQASAGQSPLLAIRQILDEIETDQTTWVVARLTEQESRFGIIYWTLGVGAVLAFLLTVLVNLSIQRDVEARQRAQGLLEQANEALTRSNRDLDQFAYVASHDLKAPLRGIATLASWLEDDLGAVLDDEHRGHLQLLRKRVVRMESLIDGILAYSRAGRKQEAPERVEVGPLVRETIDLLAVPPPTRVIVEGPMPVLVTEKVPFQQVWINLIGNAVKHGGEEIHCRAHRDGRDWAFEVADDGPGIAPEFHLKIFDIFQTLAPRDRVEGAGIGLAMVKKLVETRGGRVWVESGRGKGATFYFVWKDAPKALGFAR